MNFYDILLAKKLSGGGGGDITTEALNVTANGQYTAPQGKAYTPVNVDIKGYKVGEVETPTDIASFTASDAPLKSLTASIVPVQAGSGDPSPENIRPISGWDEVNVVVEGGQNLYSDSIVWKNGYYINASGVETQSNNYKYTQTYIEVDPSTTYSIQADITAETDLAITVPYYTEAQSFISRDLVSTVAIGTHSYKVDFTTPSNCKYIRMSVPTDTSNIVIYKKYVHTIQFKDGDNPLTVYGDSYDVVSGELKVVPYYASYNGETLEGEWISDRDVYAVGTTPTIGAQVVNIGATPQTYQLTPTQVRSLLGNNNISADTGDIIECEYIRDVTSTINDIFARIKALEEA